MHQSVLHSGRRKILLKVKLNNDRDVEKKLSTILFSPEFQVGKENGSVVMG